MAKDKELPDHKRAHSGQPGKKVDHGWSDRKWGKLEDKIYGEQYDLISKRHGKERAEKANYGWGVSGDDKYLSVATKVYHPQGNKVLLSEINHPSTDISHDWRDE